MSPRAQYGFSYKRLADALRRGRLVTTKRGFTPLARCSAFPTTRRARPGLARAVLEVAEAPRRPTGVLVGSTRRLQLGSQGPRQTRVARQSEQVVHAALLAPTHQRVAAQPRVAAQHDARLRPRAAQVSDDPLHLLDGARRRVLVGAPQPRAQQMLAAEDVQRQIAVAAVVAVEEAPLLRAMQPP